VRRRTIQTQALHTSGEKAEEEKLAAGVPPPVLRRARRQDAARLKSRRLPGWIDSWTLQVWIGSGSKTARNGLERPVFIPDWA